jgi:hypothetical protein
MWHGWWWCGWRWGWGRWVVNVWVSCIADPGCGRRGEPRARNRWERLQCRRSTRALCASFSFLFLAGLGSCRPASPSATRLSHPAPGHRSVTGARWTAQQSEICHRFAGGLDTTSTTPHPHRPPPPREAESHLPLPGLAHLPCSLQDLG